MLKITVPAMEFYDSNRNEFVKTKEQDLSLEHSLVSVSKWESKWCKPFLDKKGKTPEETLDYIKCMTLTQNVDPNVYLAIGSTPALIKQISDYIYAPMTATWFSEQKHKSVNKETVTSELVYYWMISFNIPFECQKWHFNRLMTLIQVCSVKNTPSKKMSKRDLMSRNASLNAARRAKLHTRG